jgi:alanine racemase
MPKKLHVSGRPVWVEVSLKAILKNLRVIRRHVGPKPEILAVVKSNAYGLGSVPVSKALQKAGVNWYGVTCANEGIELREAGIR